MWHIDSTGTHSRYIFATLSACLALTHYALYPHLLQPDTVPANRNMGADGGSYAHRSELVKTKAKTVKTDKDLLREVFFLCALSKVSSRVGHTVSLYLS